MWYMYNGILFGNKKEYWLMLQYGWTFKIWYLKEATPSCTVKMVNFITIKNKPPKEKKKEKESCSGLMDIKEPWQLNAIYDCVLHPGLWGK